MDPGIFPSSGDRPGFGPESQKYGDPKSEILGSADNPEQRRVPRGRRSESLFTSSRAQAVFLFADGGGDGCTAHCLTTHVLLCNDVIGP